MKPPDQKTADVAMARRGPPVSTQVPNTAADRPSITIAREKMTPIEVSEASNRWTRAAL